MTRRTTAREKTERAFRAYRELLDTAQWFEGQGLCREPKDYPFGGSFTQIGRRMLRGAPSPEWTPPWQRHTAEKTKTKMPG